jgi:hypothetical protein
MEDQGKLFALVCLRRNRVHIKSQFSSDRQAKHLLGFSSLSFWAKGSNGLIPVSVSTCSSAPPQAYKICAIGATVGDDNLPAIAAVLSLFIGCGDVLTKPKLDKHRAMCHTSFDCIDCSKRFETPADYQGHTSCISEAEKYQKTLYNGGVSERVIENALLNLNALQGQSGSERNGRDQRPRQQGGGRQRGNNRQQWQQRNVNKATGANETPLGTPVRMSPVNDTPVVEENTQKQQPAAETSKKRKAEMPETTEPKVRFY